jgi:hypothetical protein
MGFSHTFAKWPISPICRGAEYSGCRLAGRPDAIFKEKKWIQRTANTRKIRFFQKDGDGSGISLGLTGGGCSLSRTRLSQKFPGIREFCRKMFGRSDARCDGSPGKSVSFAEGGVFLAGNFIGWICLLGGSGKKSPARYSTQLVLAGSTVPLSDNFIHL